MERAGGLAEASPPASNGGGRGIRTLNLRVMNPPPHTHNDSSNKTLCQGDLGGVAPGAAPDPERAHASAIAVLAGSVAQELVEVVLAWPRLSDADKAGVLAILRGADAPAERGAGQ